MFRVRKLGWGVVWSLKRRKMVWMRLGWLLKGFRSLKKKKFSKMKGLIRKVMKIKIKINLLRILQKMIILNKLTII